MNALKSIMTGALVLVLLAGVAVAQTVDVVRPTPDTQVMVAKRATLAVMYPEGDGTEVDMIGTAINPRARGKADVKRKEGRTRIKLEMKGLGHPQSLGAYYTTYILWAIAPEGQADNIAELPVENETDKDEKYQNDDPNHLMINRPRRFVWF